MRGGYGRKREPEVEQPGRDRVCGRKVKEGEEKQIGVAVLMEERGSAEKGW